MCFLTPLSRASPASPSQVDKRMVTQMLAAYLEQSNHPKAQHEILTKMAATRRDRKFMLVFHGFWTGMSLWFLNIFELGWTGIVIL